MSITLRHRLVQASQTKADEVCTLTREDGQRRQADMGRLFSHLAEQRTAGGAHEFVFHGEPASLWEDVSLFVDEESECCPFYTYEQIEEADCVLLRVIAPPTPEAGP